LRWAFVGLIAWLTLCKFPYAVLAVLYLGVPVRRLGGFRPFARLGAATAILVLVLAAWQVQLKKYTPDRISQDPNVSMSRQLEKIRNQPARYVKVLAATVAERGGGWVHHVGLLGWLDTPVNPLAIQFYVIFVVLVALGDRTPGLHPSLWFKLCGLFAFVLGLVLILTSCYCCGCLVGARIIDGPQVRYFVPFFPLVLLPLCNRLVQVQVDRRTLLALTAAAGAGVLVVALADCGRRYYWHPDWQLRSSPLSMAVAATLFAAAVAWSRYRYGVPEENDETMRIQSWTVRADAAPLRASFTLPVADRHES
jgi:uncharacterized membrane protein